MNRSHLFGLVLLLVLVVSALPGCQQRPAVPTIAPQPTEPVVVVVVTATSQPTLAPSNTPEPTITPLPTLTPVVTGTVTATIPAATVPQATRPPAATVAALATEQPTEAAPPTTIAPSSFPAPQAIAPEGLLVVPGNTVKFQFTSVGPLASDQCYRVTMTLHFPGDPNGIPDYWVPKSLCGNQSNPGDVLLFELKPARFRDEPNYGTLLGNAEAIIAPSPQYDMRWFVDVVRVVDASDEIHPKVEALSPPSAALQNSFSR